MTSYFEALSSEGFPLTDSPRIRRLLSGCKGIYHTLTSGMTHKPTVLPNGLYDY